MCVCVCVWVGVANSVWVWLVGLNKQPFVPRYFGYQGSVELFIVSKGVSFVYY
jgi:hypothetical protein